jgi:hypothetical protein
MHKTQALSCYGGTWEYGGPDVLYRTIWTSDRVEETHEKQLADPWAKNLT